MTRAIGASAVMRHGLVRKAMACVGKVGAHPEQSNLSKLLNAVAQEMDVTVQSPREYDAAIANGMCKAAIRAAVQEAAPAAVPRDFEGTVIAPLEMRAGRKIEVEMRSSQRQANGMPMRHTSIDSERASLGMAH